MKQEQKTFEIKETGDFKLEYSGYGANYVNEEVEGYVNAANAEIRRLQEQVLGFERDTTDWQLEVANLRQQLADAPTWGEWQDDKNQFQAGTYEVEFDNGNRVLLQIDSETLIMWTDSVTRFRRLKYEPKAAREVESEYMALVKNAAVSKDDFSNLEWKLANDYLSALQKIAELEGER